MRSQGTTNTAERAKCPLAGHQMPLVYTLRLQCQDHRGQRGPWLINWVLPASGESRVKLPTRGLPRWQPAPGRTTPEESPLDLSPLSVHNMEFTLILPNLSRPGYEKWIILQFGVILIFLKGRFPAGPNRLFLQQYCLQRLVSSLLPRNIMFTHQRGAGLGPRSAVTGLRRT